jgi:hypothetical protein
MIERLLLEKIEFARWQPIVASILLLGFGVFCGYSAFPNPKSEIIAEVPHYVQSDNAIANFGARPVNPQWFEIGQKSGTPLETIPAPDQMVFTFPVEPVIEKIEPPKERSWEPPKWKVTFK